MNADDILQAISDGLKQELSTGYSTIKGFVESQGKLLAGQAEMIARQRIAGSLSDDDDLYEFFLDGLKTNTENMAKSVAMLTALTIERAWNAIAKALWGGLRTILTAAGLPGPLVPETPPHV